jgi:hypothetical protein
MQLARTEIDTRVLKNRVLPMQLGFSRPASFSSSASAMFESSAHTAKINKVMRKANRSHVALERPLHCGPVNPKNLWHMQCPAFEEREATHNMCDGQSNWFGVHVAGLAEPNFSYASTAVTNDRNTNAKAMYCCHDNNENQHGPIIALQALKIQT